MNQQNVDKLSAWMQANKTYTPEQLKQAALQGGATEEEFQAAFNLTNQSMSSTFSPEGGSSTAAVAAGMEYKGVGIRFLALLIDSVLLGLVMVAMSFALGTYTVSQAQAQDTEEAAPLLSAEDFSPTELPLTSPDFPQYSVGLNGLPALLFFLVGFAYFIILEWKLGGTLGKLAVGIRVVNGEGHKISLGASVIRNLLRIVDGLFAYLVGAILVWTSPTKQRLGDRVAKTYVVAKHCMKA